MKHFAIAIILFSMLFSACQSGQKSTGENTFSATNSGQSDLTDVVIRITDPSILAAVRSIGTENLSVVAGEPVPFQLIGEGNAQELLVLADMAAGETKTFILERTDNPVSFPKRTYAELSVKEGGEWVEVVKRNGNRQHEYQGGEFKNIQSLRVPDEHTDHSFYIRYEGPGWESDKIGYRFYLDWRNAVDIFGKKVNTMVLPQVGLDGFDSYHEIADWGVDILKVANTLGIGTIAYFDGEKANRVAVTDSVYSEVTYNGDIESKITTRYYGWDLGSQKTNLISEISIQAGSYFTRQDLTVSESVDNLSTGLIILPETTVLTSEGMDGEWAYLATFGKQSLENDMLGMSIFYKKSDLIELTQDGLSHVVVLKPANNKLTYYYGAAWEQDASQMKTEAQFIEFLNVQLARLNTDVVVK